jgi:Domain of unknown function (DUF4157)
MNTVAHDPNQDDEVEELSGLPPEQLSEELARDIAKRWDPERLLKLVAARAGKGEALDASLRARYEQKLGVDLGHVRIYSGEFAEEFNRARNADAVTIGGTGMILMGNSPERSMATAAGHGLLAHELTHVAQAERGLYNAGSGNADMPLASEEHEAEAEAAEHEEQQARGAQGPADHTTKGDKKEKLRKQLVERVMDMLGEWSRVELMRSGDPMRRP